MPHRTKTVIRKFLAFVKATRSPSTHAYYASQLAKILNKIGGKIASRLRPIDLTTWAKGWHETQAVKRCFTWAAKEAKLLRNSPFDTVRLPAMRGRRRVLLPVELARFLRGQGRAARLFFLAMRETLARPQEIRAARFCDLRSENPRQSIGEALKAGSALIVLEDFKSRERRATDSGPRVLMVSRRLGRSIARLMRKGVANSSPIFVNSQGKAWTKNAVRCVVRRARIRLGIDRDERGERFVAYTIRHTTATELAAQGVLDRTLADVLGHTETRTTARYQHLCVSHLRAAVDRARLQARPERRPQGRTHRKKNSGNPTAN